MDFPAVALAWHCVSVSFQWTQRVSSFVWPAGTCAGLKLLAQLSSPLTPKPRWPCCRWTPAASPLSLVLHRRSKRGGRNELRNTEIKSVLDKSSPITSYADSSLRAIDNHCLLSAGTTGWTTFT